MKPKCVITITFTIMSVIATLSDDAGAQEDLVNDRVINNDGPLSDHLTTNDTLLKPEKTYYSYAERRRDHLRDLGPLSLDAPAPEFRRERVRNFYLVPYLGTEIVNIDSRLYTVGPTPTFSNVQTGPVYGLAAGWRLGYLSLGTRYQGSLFGQSNFTTLSINKFYVEVGVNTHYRVLLFEAFVAGGYTMAATGSTYANGLGGKVGVAFDFIVRKFFTIGPGMSFDVQAFQPGNGPWVIALGGTGLLRFGFHL